MAKIYVYKPIKEGESDTPPAPKVEKHYKTTFFTSLRKLLHKIKNEENIHVILFDYERENIHYEKLDFIMQKLAKLPNTLQIFKIILHPSMATNMPQERWKYFQLGVNMITANRKDVDEIVQTIISIVLSQLQVKNNELITHNNNNDNNNNNYNNLNNNNELSFQCPYCFMSALKEEPLYIHVEIYHANLPNIGSTCVVCKGKKDKNIPLTNIELDLLRLAGSKSPFAVHLHGCHGPCVRNPELSEFVRNKNLPIFSFALTVVRNNIGKYLLVQEFCNEGFWLPGGRVDPSEALSAAASRETLEEGGIDVDIKGILKIEYYPRKTWVKFRVIFYAEPRDPLQLPKSKPDFESVGATWAAPSDIPFLKLRGKEPKTWIEYLEGGGQIYPLSLLDDK